MPLTDELGGRAIESLQAAGHIRATQAGFGPELSFESWLSLLSEEQPQLSEADNRDNAALFARLRDAIAAHLVDAQRQALLQPPPSWLYELISVLHRREAIVVTLNYDALVETAVASHSLWDPINRRQVMPSDLLRNLPPLPNVGARLVGPLSDTFRLLKLHGSLDWWAVPNDSSGATLNREPTQGAFEDLHEMTDDERQRELPGRERFIIPPLSTKSTYYRNPLTRELWQQAYAALRNAARISIVGYSLPPADTVMANMLRDAFTDRAVIVDLVNSDPDALQSRLIGLGAKPELLTVVSENNCVESFARTLCAEATAELAGEFKRPQPPEVLTASLAVAWGSAEVSGPTVRRVVQLQRRDETTLDLILEADVPRQGPTSVRRAADGTLTDRSFPTGADLAEAISRCDRVVARDAQGVHTLISARREGRNVGANRYWITFVPADRGFA
jgi:hypothetical protein